MEGTSEVRIGILGAARIAPTALIRPSRQVEGARVVAVAARDAERARAFARKHEIPRVHPSYRGVDLRSGDRRDLQPPPQRPPRRVDDPGAAPGETRPVREADGVERRGGGANGRVAGETGRFLVEAFH